MGQPPCGRSLVLCRDKDGAAVSDMVQLTILGLWVVGVPQQDVCGSSQSGEEITAVPIR